eukprot:jgi/Chrzof1/8906/Cz03g28200.t1
MSSSKVQLYVYDLTQGLARQMSPMFLGRQIEGVWHTGVVLGGIEYFFGFGINRTRAGTTPFGSPYRVVDLGTTEVPHDMVEDLLTDLQPRFRPQDYNLLFNNCNHFSNELSLLLTGNGIPEYILSQAQDVLDTPMGQMLMPMLLQMEGVTGNATATGFNGGVPSIGTSSSTTTVSTTTTTMTPMTQPTPTANGDAACPSTATTTTVVITSGAEAPGPRVTSTVVEATAGTPAAASVGSTIPAAAAAAAAGPSDGKLGLSGLQIKADSSTHCIPATASVGSTEPTAAAAADTSDGKLGLSGLQLKADSSTHAN